MGEIGKRRLRVFAKLLGEEMEIILGHIDEMSDQHALGNDRKFYAAAKRAGHSAELVKQVLELVATDQIDEAERLLGINPKG